VQKCKRKVSGESGAAWQRVRLFPLFGRRFEPKYPLTVTFPPPSSNSLPITTSSSSCLARCCCRRLPRPSPSFLRSLFLPIYGHRHSFRVHNTPWLACFFVNISSSFFPTFLSALSHHFFDLPVASTCSGSAALLLVLL